MRSTKLTKIILSLDSTPMTFSGAKGQDRAATAIEILWTRSPTNLWRDLNQNLAYINTRYTCETNLLGFQGRRSNVKVMIRRVNLSWRRQTLRRCGVEAYLIRVCIVSLNEMILYWRKKVNCRDSLQRSCNGQWTLE